MAHFSLKHNIISPRIKGSFPFLHAHQNAESVFRDSRRLKIFVRIHSLLSLSPVPTIIFDILCGLQVVCLVIVETVNSVFAMYYTYDRLVDNFGALYLTLST